MPERATLPLIARPRDRSSFDRLEDLDRGILAVRKSFAQTGASVALKSSKGGRERIIPLSALAVEALQTQRFRQAEDAFRAGEGYAS